MKNFGLAAVCLLLGFWACNPQTAKVTTEAIPDKDVEIATDAGKIVTVAATAENVRKKPNGEKIGSVRKGQQLTVIKKVGNWVKFENEKFDAGYIWAPSVGYNYKNIYNPFFFYDSTRSAFHSVDFFQKAFSQRGQKRQETSSSCEIFLRRPVWAVMRKLFWMLLAPASRSLNMV